MKNQQPIRIYNIPAWLFFWLPSIYVTLHSLEELTGGFGPWATEHFGTHSTLLFAATHIPILLVVYLASYKASQIGKHGGWMVFLAAWQIQFGLNALFHLTAAAWFMEYSPGMMTAGALGFVLTYYVIRRMWREKRLNGKELAWATILGTLIATSAIGILLLDLD